MRRSGWLAGRAGVATALVVAGGLLAGLCAWAGAATQSSGVGIGTLLEAGANVVPPSLCFLGLGFLALGAWPRAAGAVTYGLLAWSLLIEVAAGAVQFGPLAARHVGVPPDGLGPGHRARLGQRRPPRPGGGGRHCPGCRGPGPPGPSRRLTGGGQ